MPENTQKKEKDPTNPESSDVKAIEEAVILEEHVVSKKEKGLAANTDDKGVPLAAKNPTTTPVVPVAPQPVVTIPKDIIPPLETSPVQSKGELNKDVSRILQDIKLPERKEFRATGDSKTYENKIAALSEPKDEPVIAQVMPQSSMLEGLQAPLGIEKKEGADIPSVHTLKDDLHGLVQDQKMSMVKAAALEEEKRARRDVAEKQARPREGRVRLRKMLISILILLILGGLALLLIALVSGQRETATQPVLQSIMFAEKTLSFPIDNYTPRELKTQLSLSRSQIALTLGGMARIVPTLTITSVEGNQITRPATTEEFLQYLGARIPEGFARALGSEFFFGVHAVDENVPVVVVPVAVYERAFAGMLLWEENINEDLAPLFTAVPAQTISSDGTIEPRVFEDIILQNYDVRAMKDPSGTVRLLYSFPTRNILIIAESTHSFVETLSRLRAERRL